MKKLISVLNSGESLEKALILAKLGMEQNREFYSNYDEVEVIYFENLPKKDKNGKYIITAKLDSASKIKKRKCSGCSRKRKSG